MSTCLVNEEGQFRKGQATWDLPKKYLRFSTNHTLAPSNQNDRGFCGLVDMAKTFTPSPHPLPTHVFLLRELGRAAQQLESLLNAQSDPELSTAA